MLKNAIDYLFNEWKGRSAMIVSYGGHGGTKAAGQLRQVLQGVDMEIVETMPGLSFPGRKVLGVAAVGGDLPLNGEGAIWGEEKEGILRAFKELLLLVDKETSKVGA